MNLIFSFKFLTQLNFSYVVEDFCKSLSISYIPRTCTFIHSHIIVHAWVFLIFRQIRERARTDTDLDRLTRY